MKFLSTATLLLTSVASISAQNTTSAQNTSQNAPTGILATIEQQINNVIPGGLASLQAAFPQLGSSVSGLSGPLTPVLGYLGPLLATPQGSSALNSILNGKVPSFPSLNNVSLSTFIPPACQQAIYKATANRTDCQPLYNLIQHDSARQNQTAVGNACSPANAGCLQAVQHTVQQNEQICESWVNYGIPGFSNMNVDYTGLIFEGLCTQANIDGKQQYCLPTWDKGANDLKAHGYSNNASVAELCNQPCRDALAYNIQSNQSAPQQINYANVLNAACAIDPATQQYCAIEIANNTQGNVPVEASKFCSPCARIEMALGAAFTNSTPSQYYQAIETIEGLACASDPASGELCSTMIYNQAKNASSGLQQFVSNTQLTEQCALSVLLQNTCPQQCGAPLVQFVDSLGSCGGLLISNSTLSYSSLLPSPFNQLARTVFTNCAIRPQQPPTADAYIIANLVGYNVTRTNGTRVSSILAGVANQGHPSTQQVQQAVNYTHATVLSENNVFNITTDSAISVGQIAQRLADAVYAGRFGNGSTIAVVPYTVNKTIPQVS